MTPAQKQQCNFVITSPFTTSSKKAVSGEMQKQNIVRRKVEDTKEQLRLKKELAL